MHSPKQDEHHQRLHAIVHGRVQGVNFRSTSVREASALGLSGWVRNLRNGTVEVVAEGPRPQLARLLQFLRVGPSAANVTGVDVAWEEPTGEFDQFRVRF